MPLTAIQECRDRVRLICEAALPGVLTVPSSFNSADAPPYFKVRVGASAYTRERSEDYEFRTRQVIVHYAAGRLTAGKYMGEPDDLIAANMETLENAFMNSPQLIIAPTYPTVASWHADMHTEIIDNTGLAAFELGGAGIADVGCMLTLAVPFIYIVSRNWSS